MKWNKKLFNRALPVFFLLLMPALVLGQQEDTIKVATTLVAVPVIVTDAQQHYITGLRADDFVIKADGIKQEVAFFESADDPIHIVLIIDTSVSTTKILRDIKRAANRFLDELRPTDRVMVVSFDHQVQILSPFVNDYKSVKKIINSTRSDEEYLGSRMYDALYEVTINYLQDIKGKKAVILLTDGVDGDSRTQRSIVFNHLYNANETIYTILYTTLDSKLLDSSTIDKFAEISGGFVYPDKGDLNKTFHLLATELRNQYQLGFYLDASDDSVHEIKVETTRPLATIRARKFYRAN